jgi:hypothetical protein
LREDIRCGPLLLQIARTFRALRHRDFRLLWGRLAVSAVGTWMQIVAQSLLVLKITYGSAFALGRVSLAQALACFLRWLAEVLPIALINATF